jgi:hypothetical protein
MRLIELTIAATIGATLDGEELGKRSGKRMCRHQEQSGPAAVGGLSHLTGSKARNLLLLHGDNYLAPGSTASQHIISVW